MNSHWKEVCVDCFWIGVVSLLLIAAGIVAVPFIVIWQPIKWLIDKGRGF
jgi:hypothetical protein